MRLFARALLFVLCANLALPASAAGDRLTQTWTNTIQPSLIFIETQLKGGKSVMLGSGFVIGSRDGHALILTDHHVIAKGVKILGARQEPEYQRFTLKPVQIDQRFDLAVLESSGPELPALTLADGVPPLGRDVAIAGYPHTQLHLAQEGFDLTASLHRGTVNALPGNGGYVQYDAQTEHGNSGGPMFDVDSGLVYGIVDLALEDKEQSNLATSTLVIRRLLEKSKIAYAHAPADAPEVASAVESFGTKYNELMGAFNRWQTAASKSSALAGNGANVSGITAIVARISVNNELKAIRSVITDEEPKLDAQLSAVHAIGDTSVAAKFDKLVADIKARDQDASTWSMRRSQALNQTSYGVMPAVDTSAYDDARTIDATISSEIADIKANACR